jgi:uncharacterized FlaG/YvyC family protein
MATQYELQAQQQLAPAYDQQIQGLQSQIPAIQQLYQTLSQGLNQEYQTNLNTGVQNINEDASARGVLRSTLPNDSRLTLTGQLGAALQQSLGQAGLQQTKDISGVRSQIGDLNIKKVSSIADLSSSLQQQDEQRRQFDQELALARQKASSSGNTSPTDVKFQLATALNQDILGFFGSKEASQRGYTESQVLPQLIAAYPELGAQAIIDAVYKTRKAIGLG